MFYKKIIRPFLFRSDSEEIHDTTLDLLQNASRIPFISWLIKKFLTVRDSRLEQKLFGLTFPNPVGLAAGMDKNGIALRGFEMLGLGHIELGGITANRQEGNTKPRLFRLPLDQALINRMGFNNHGAERVAENLFRHPKRLPTVPLGINIGKSKDADVNDMDAVVNDYCYTFGKLYRFASFFVVNVSSPNTLGLRKLQGREFLKILLTGIQSQNLRMPRAPGERLKPILLKIAPDLEWNEIDEILEVVRETEIDGIVATNTTVKRENLKTTGALAIETGGLSGKPLYTRALEVVGHIRKQCPTLPIIGVGGILSGNDAYEMIHNGANLVQIYTGLVYNGPLFVREINLELLNRMKYDGIRSVSEWGHLIVRT